MFANLAIFAPACASFLISNLTSCCTCDPSRPQAAAEGLALEAVPRLPLAAGERVICNVCAATVANLHARCGACDWDVCAACCADARATAGGSCSGGGGGGLACPNRGGPCGGAGRLRLARILGDGVLQDLRGIVAVSHQLLLAACSRIGL